MNRLPALLIVAGIACCMNAACVFSSANALKPASIPESEVIEVSTATPAVQVADDASDATDVSDEATTAEAHDAVDPEAVSLTTETGSPAPDNQFVDANKMVPVPLQSTVFSHAITAPAPVPVPQGRYVLTSQPVYGRFGRVLSYRQVWVWQGPRYQYQTRYQYYGNCANGVCR